MPLTMDYAKAHMIDTIYIDAQDGRWKIVVEWWDNDQPHSDSKVVGRWSDVMEVLAKFGKKEA
jgi:hypothetical protein